MRLSTGCDRPTGVVLVTSGLGPRFGGIGVVSSQIAVAVGVRGSRVWRHHHRWPSAARRAGLLARAAMGSLVEAGLIIYEHVDLAVIHQVVPWLSLQPYAVFLHGQEVWKPLAGRKRRAVANASVLLANSATTVAEARRHNPWMPPVEVIHLGVEPSGAGLPAGHRPPVALMVGRMAPDERYKGHRQVIEAWPSIRAAVPSAKLIVVGDGEDRARLESLAATTSGIRFTGWVPSEVREELYRECRLFLQPSLKEGFGLAAVEAASAGAPLLGLRGTVLEELFPVPRTVALAVTQQACDIAAAAIPILVDADEATRMGTAGRARVRECFLKDHFTERVRTALARWVI